LESEIQIIKKVVQVANANIDFDERLQAILEIVTQRGDIQKGLLLLLAPNKGMLELKNISPREIPRPIWSIPLEKNPFADCLKNRRFLFIPRLNRREHKNILKIPFFKGFASLLVWPVEDDNYLYGLLCLLSREAQSRGEEDRELLPMVCREMAGVIRNSKVYTEAKKRIAELSVLYQVGKVIGSTLELEDLVKRTVAIIAQVINARGSALIITNGADQAVKIEAEFGVIPPFTKGVLTREILEGKGPYISPLETPKAPIPAVSEKMQPEAHSRGEETQTSRMCTPLRFKGPYQGRLCVYGRVAMEAEGEAQFSQDDLSILSTIGNIIASSLENALTFQQLEALARKNETMVKNLSILYQINSAMMTTASYEELLRIILESITLKEGLGFNRAILLLVDEESKSLKAVKGSVQEPETVSGEEKPDTSGSGLSRLLVSKASRVSDEAQALDRQLQAITIPLSKEKGILARTAMEGRFFLIKEAQKDPRTNKRLVERLGIDSFASVPIFAKDKVIGVISVDNYFDRHPIEEEDLQILSMLARQAGLAIENARLYEYIEQTNQELKSAQERLLESEKLTALGEMAAGMAHEIRNPLVSIGGFVRRLFKKFQGDSQVQTYFQVIINEVERLEKTLNEILDFSQDTQGKFKEEDLNQIVEEALELIRRELDESRIAVQKELNPLPRVYCDGRQIRHVFYNLFLNALQAMPHGGVLGIRTEGSKGSDSGWATVEIRDTGGGIPPELLHNIFNPFFTTKASGSGLGLSIVHKIVTRHYGNVEIDNRPGEGVSFFIKLPLLKGSPSLFHKFKFNGEESNEKNINRR
jgi:two-component system, NtrC family, sensor histidine kinase HydH